MMDKGSGTWVEWKELSVGSKNMPQMNPQKPTNAGIMLNYQQPQLLYVHSNQGNIIIVRAAN